MFDFFSLDFVENNKMKVVMEFFPLQTHCLGKFISYNKTVLIINISERNQWIVSIICKENKYRKKKYYWKNQIDNCILNS